MKMITTTQVVDMLRANIISAALGTALELGLFWRLSEGPRTWEAVAGELNISIGRCRYWLDLFVSLAQK
jgi:hypothetical protein